MPEQTLDAAVIMSSAYVGAELAAEVGPLPPAFLPIHNGRLFERQVTDLQAIARRVFLTVPLGFVIDEADRRWLEAHHVTVIGVDSTAALAAAVGTAVRTVLEETGQPDLQIGILHGDTLFETLVDVIPDSVSVGIAVPEYAWAEVEVTGGRARVIRTALPEEEPELVLTGWFAFSSACALLTAVDESGGFVDALETYRSRHGLLAVDPGGWHDAGHVHTYFRARQRLTTERSFNQLRARGRTVEKRSERGNRIAAESHWFETAPAAVREFLPQYFGRTADGAGYAIEYLYLLPLNDLLVFGRLPLPVWRQILGACCQFLELARTVAVQPDAGSEPGDGSDLYVAKSRSRLGEIAAAGFDVEAGWTLNGEAAPALRDIVEDCIARATAEPVLPGLLHGDLCFSNVLWDFRTKGIKLIDPRGESADGRLVVGGDTRYDLAKLAHSILGGYDLIVAGRFELERDGHALTFSLAEHDGHRRLADAFGTLMDKAVGPQQADAVRAMVVLLFVSMLPLHAESPTRQWALLANALRLHRDLPPMSTR